MKVLKYIVLAAALLIRSSPSIAQSADSLRILSYNVKHGFEGDTVAMSRYITWVKGISPDVVMYQEMNGFTQKKLAALAQKYGHVYSIILNQESGFDATHPLALTSRYPIIDVKMYLDSMWHGCIHAKVEGLDLFVTHLAPFTLKDRQKDAARIAAYVKELPPSANVLIGGDFNALSRSDSAGYGPRLISSIKRLEGRLEPKSGTAIVKYRTIYRNNLNNGQIDYSVTDTLLQAGLIDAVRFKNARFRNSVPTKVNLNKNSVPRRVDYIWVNPALSRYLLRAEIIQDSVTDSLSDHYPVLIVCRRNIPKH